MAELKAFGALQARNRLSRALAGHVGGGFEPETHEISLSSFNSQQLLDPTPVRHAGDTLVCRAQLALISPTSYHSSHSKRAQTSSA